MSHQFSQMILIAVISAVAACDSKQSGKTFVADGKRKEADAKPGASTTPPTGQPPQGADAPGTGTGTGGNATAKDPLAPLEIETVVLRTSSCKAKICDFANRYVQAGIDNEGCPVCAKIDNPTNPAEKPFTPRFVTHVQCLPGYASDPFWKDGAYLTIDPPDGPPVDWYSLNFGVRFAGGIKEYTYGDFTWPRTHKIAGNQRLLSAKLLFGVGFFTTGGTAFVPYMTIVAENSAGPSPATNEVIIPFCHEPYGKPDGDG